MVRLEKYKEADEAELSEPGGGAAPVVWRIVCLRVSMQGTLVWSGLRKIKCALHRHFGRCTEQDAELVIFLWFKYIKTLASSCTLYPI